MPLKGEVIFPLLLTARVSRAPRPLNVHLKNKKKIVPVPQVNKVKCLNERRCYVLADVIILVYEVPCIFWHYINVDEAS